MKQFSLEEFKKNPTRKVVTRSRKPVRIICTDAKGDYPVIGLVHYTGGDERESPNTYTENGSYDISNDEDARDLFFAPEKKEGWVNIYKLNEHYMRAGDLVFKTKEEAAKSISSEDYVATVHIELEE